MSDDFYSAFEEKHRGSRELILSRLAVYRPIISPLKAIYPASPAVDLGCGKGEWLELLLDEGFSPFGIDQDEGMLQHCHERNLPAQQGDAIEYLATLADDSQTIISAFHVVEHIPFDKLRTLVLEALRVLKPGGLLIMETPNPENIVVSTRNFYLDPTHQHPIPPQLLSFLPEYYGFARVKTIRLQESKDLMKSESLTLRNVLEGVSPDYAVIAQKAADETILKVLDAAFAVEYGLSLETLAARYHTQLETTAHQATKRAAQAEAKAQQATEHAAQAEVHAQKAEVRVQALLSSTSWRITAPLRWFGTQARLLRQHGFCPRAKALVKKLSKPMMQWVFSYISVRPSLRFKCVNAAEKLGLYRPLRTIYHRYIGHHHSHAVNPTVSKATYGESLANLSPGARMIYANLKAAIEKNKRVL